MGVYSCFQDDFPYSLFFHLPHLKIITWRLNWYCSLFQYPSKAWVIDTRFFHVVCALVFVYVCMYVYLQSCFMKCLRLSCRHDFPLPLIISVYFLKARMFSDTNTVKLSQSGKSTCAQYHLIYRSLQILPVAPQCYFSGLGSSRRFCTVMSLW